MNSKWHLILIRKFLLSLFLLLVAMTSSSFALQIKTGSYTGNGSSGLAITVGFQPDIVIVRGNDNNWRDFVVATSSMPAGDAKGLDSYWAATGLDSTIITSLTAAGFTVGTSHDSNDNGVLYSWIAIKADSTYASVGSYSGDGTANRSITGTGFQPDVVLVMNGTGPSYWEPCITLSSFPAGDSITTNGNAANPLSGVHASITSLTSNGFTVGSGAAVDYANNNGQTYYYVALRQLTGYIKVGSYTGNGVNNTSITGTGFQPAWTSVFPLNAGNSAPTNVSHLPGTPASTDQSFGYYHTIFQEAGDIQAEQANGFEVGTNANTNTNATTYYYLSVLDYGAQPSVFHNIVMGNAVIQ